MSEQYSTGDLHEVNLRHTVRQASGQIEEAKAAAIPIIVDHILGYEPVQLFEDRTAFTDKNRRLRFGRRSVSFTPSQPEDENRQPLSESDYYPTIELTEATSIVRYRRSLFRPFEDSSEQVTYTLEYFRDWNNGVAPGRTGVTFFYEPNGDVLAGGDPTTMQEVGLDIQPPIDVFISLLARLNGQLNDYDKRAQP